MNMVRTIFSASIVALAVGASACAAQNDANEATEASDAPVASTDTIGESDEGTDYNGWSHTVTGYWGMYDGYYAIDSIFTRYYGDATRGGGMCYAVASGAGCSSDASCTAQAQAQYGGSAYGYCYSGSCYNRPGPQSGNCALSPNRAPGALTITPSSFSYYGVVIGCMTKTAGPNTACGGTDSSQYIRSLGYITTNFNPN
jgi:hypothetical protein